MQQPRPGPADLPLAVIRAGVPPGSFLFDLGAHVGEVAVPAADDGYKVLAVEASPTNAIELYEAARERDDLLVINAAVMDRAGLVDFLEDGLHGHVVGEATEDTVRISAVTVDGLWTAHGCPEVAFVKLDLEGGEVAALRGMADLHAETPPPSLLCESNGPRLAAYGESPQTLLGLLARRGYRCFLATPGRLIPVEPDDLQPSCVVDYLAVPARHNPWEDWVAPPMSEQELRARIEAEQNSPDPAKRAWIAAALSDAGVGI